MVTPRKRGRWGRATRPPPSVLPSGPLGDDDDVGTGGEAERDKAGKDGSDAQQLQRHGTPSPLITSTLGSPQRRPSRKELEERGHQGWILATGPDASRGHLTV